MKYSSFEEALASGDETFTVGKNEYRRTNTPGIGYTRILKTLPYSIDANNTYLVGENISSSSNNSTIIGNGPFTMTADNSLALIYGSYRTYAVLYETDATSGPSELYLHGTVDGRIEIPRFSVATLILFISDGDSYYNRGLLADSFYADNTPDSYLTIQRLDGKLRISTQQFGANIVQKVFMLITPVDQ